MTKYELSDSGTLYIYTDANFTIDLLPGMLREILLDLPLGFAERIEVIELIQQQDERA